MRITHLHRSFELSEDFLNKRGGLGMATLSPAACDQSMSENRLGQSFDVIRDHIIAPIRDRIGLAGPIKCQGRPGAGTQDDLRMRSRGGHKIQNVFRDARIDANLTGIGLKAEDFRHPQDRGQRFDRFAPPVMGEDGAFRESIRISDLQAEEEAIHLAFR